MKIDNTRHSAIFRADGWKVALIGAGGIGSPTALALAKMGIEHIEVFDADTVDDVNVSCQMYGNDDIGKYKVDALEDLVALYADNVIIPRYFNVGLREGVEADIIISAVDSLKARKEIWGAVKAGYSEYYLDARMGSEQFQLFSVDPHNYLWYEQLVMSYNDEDLPTEACTSKATIYCAFAAAGHIARAVRMILTNEHTPGILSHDIRKETIEWISLGR